MIPTTSAPAAWISIFGYSLSPFPPMVGNGALVAGSTLDLFETYPSELLTVVYVGFWFI